MNLPEGTGKELRVAVLTQVSSLISPLSVRVCSPHSMSPAHTKLKEPQGNG